MSNDCSPEPANRVVTLHKTIDREADGAAAAGPRIMARSGVSRGALYLAYVDAPSRELSAQPLPEEPEKSFWSSVFDFLVEGFANCAAPLYPVAYFNTGGSLIETDIPLRETFAPTERRTVLSLVPNSPRRTEDGNPTTVLAMVSRTSSQTFPDVPHRGASKGGSLSALPSGRIERPARWNWLRSCWETVVSLYTHLQREREIRKAVDALDQLDDFTLKDIGIHHRGQIEHAVRNAGHDL